MLAHFGVFRLQSFLNVGEDDLWWDQVVFDGLADEVQVFLIHFYLALQYNQYITWYFTCLLTEKLSHLGVYAVYFCNHFHYQIQIPLVMATVNYKFYQLFTVPLCIQIGHKICCQINCFLQRRALSELTYKGFIIIKTEDLRRLYPLDKQGGKWSCRI